MSIEAKNVRMKTILSDLRYRCTAINRAGIQEQFKLVLEMQRRGDLEYNARMEFDSALIYSCDMEVGAEYRDNLNVKIISIVFQFSPTMFSRAAVHRISQYATTFIP